MNGKYPEKLREKIKDALKKAKKWVQKKAKDGPLKIFLMTPDPTGAGTAFASIDRKKLKEWDNLLLHVGPGNSIFLKN